MLYDLSKTYQTEQAKVRLDQLIKKEAKIELTEKKPKRTLDQNRYMHAIFSLYGIEFGYEREYVKQVTFKIEVNRETFHTTYTDKETGEILDRWRSTADLDTRELTLAIERFRDYSAKNGLYLLSGDEYIQNYHYIQQQINQHKQYL